MSISIVDRPQELPEKRVFCKECQAWRWERSACPGYGTTLIRDYVGKLDP